MPVTAAIEILMMIMICLSLSVLERRHTNRYDWASELTIKQDRKQACYAHVHADGKNATLEALRPQGWAAASIRAISVSPSCSTIC